MADMLRDASVWLGRVLRQHASQPVVYVRGSHRVQVDATIGRTTFETTNTGGVVVETESRDFIVDADDLLLPSGITTPQRGDRIHEMRGTTKYIYEVTPLGEDGRCYRPADGYHNKLRIHTKEIGRA